VTASTLKVAELRGRGMRHLLSIADLSSDEVRGLVKLAGDLKGERQAGRSKPLLAGQSLGLVFQRPSLRTRASFDVAMRHLGGRALYLSLQEIQLGRRESVKDVARVLSRYVHALVARVRAHVELVINGLSDYTHPCEILGDLFTIREKRGRLAGLRLAYVGDGNNIAHSLLLGASKVGMEIRMATPEGYAPRRDVVHRARSIAQDTGGEVWVGTDPVSAVRGADIIYTDVWASMGQETEREARLRTFRPYQVNAELVGVADADVMVMHCLPAHRGEEITAEVLDGPHSIVHDQAENKLHMHKTILARTMSDWLPTTAGEEEMAKL
jgi:ornithine carbamoyltransferase